MAHLLLATLWTAIVLGGSAGQMTDWSECGCFLRNFNVREHNSSLAVATATFCAVQAPEKDACVDYSSAKFSSLRTLRTPDKSARERFLPPRTIKVFKVIFFGRPSRTGRAPGGRAGRFEVRGSPGRRAERARRSRRGSAGLREARPRKRYM